MTGNVESRAAALWRYILDGLEAAGVVGWTLFWGNVVRLHLVTGDPVDAGATALLLLGPVVALVAWRLGARMDAVDVETTPVERALSS